jgi:hypothetical protein
MSPDAAGKLGARVFCAAHKRGKKKENNNARTRRCVVCGSRGSIYLLRIPSNRWDMIYQTGCKVFCTSMARVHACGQRDANNLHQPLCVYVCVCNCNCGCMLVCVIRMHGRRCMRATGCKQCTPALVCMCVCMCVQVHACMRDTNVRTPVRQRVDSTVDTCAYTSTHSPRAHTHTRTFCVQVAAMALGGGHGAKILALAAIDHSIRVVAADSGLHSPSLPLPLSAFLPSCCSSFPSSFISVALSRSMPCNTCQFTEREREREREKRERERERERT